MTDPVTLVAPADADLEPNILPDRLLQETLCPLDRLGVSRDGDHLLVLAADAPDVNEGLDGDKRGRGRGVVSPSCRSSSRWRR